MTQDPHDVQKTALAVRKGFIEARELSFQAACMLAIRQLWRKAATENERVDFTPPPGSLFINSSWKWVIQLGLDLWLTDC